MNVLAGTWSAFSGLRAYRKALRKSKPFIINDPLAHWFTEIPIRPRAAFEKKEKKRIYSKNGGLKTSSIDFDELNGGTC